MKSGRYFFLACLSVLAGAETGCIAAAPPDGMGGSGGSNLAMLRVAHLAPEMPAKEDTTVDFVIVDEGAFTGVPFARVSAFTSLSPDFYTIHVVPAGTADEPLATTVPTLEAGRRYTLVAHRASGETGSLGFFLFEHDTSGLVPDSGRVVMGHGVDDSSWQSVDVVDTEAEEVLIEDLAFGAQSNPTARPEGVLDFGFDVAPSSSSTIDAGPFSFDVPGGAYSVLVVVDQDTADGSVDSAVFAIEPMTEGSIAPLPSP